MILSDLETIFGDDYTVYNGSVIDVSKIFGQMVFDDNVMKERLPKRIYDMFKKAVNEHGDLTLEVADVIANAMKDWALEKGATHFTHWFQPMTGVTAEKHDSFLTLKKSGKVMMDFSGKELIRGEPDASSFPSGGLRATFEARGYTAWDPTSHAFLKDGTLCIPTVFYSYSGDVLDKKVPLLRSMNALNKQAIRILRLFGNDSARRVFSTVGAEQEYFLIDKEMAKKRKDLLYCGRTLFGSKPVKGQDLGDHYFGVLKPRVSKFMKEIDIELWKLGIPVKTKHNEVAPAQHELAQLYVPVNTAADQNQIVMETLKNVAEKHGLMCLLHEKPFEGINGSGKHNNWSLQTDTGLNLFEPGNSPYANAQFLLFLCAVIKGVDEYPELLRISVASAGNDRRLGGDEAPPAVESVFIGDELLEILEAVENGSEYQNRDRLILEIGVDTLPKFPKDSTDRNRTSPFAFTGNKFEFRMVGSSESISGVNMVLNTILADELKGFADKLESTDDFQNELNNLLIDTIKNHKKVIFNGNNYSESWQKEAKNRNLPNLRTVADAVPHYEDRKNVELFVRHSILSEKEVKSRCEIQLENYCKLLHIEALTMIDMANREILPSVMKYLKEIAKSINQQKSACIDLDLSALQDVLLRTSNLFNSIKRNNDKLKELILNSPHCDQAKDLAIYYRDGILPQMDKLRSVSDEAESVVPQEFWPYPTYGQLLFSV